jgi:hypothetical protein
MEWKRKPPDDEGWGGEILARYERGVMLLLFILAATMVALNELDFVAFLGFSDTL